jgi:predicted nuclease with TOPRIM domain
MAYVTGRDIILRMMVDIADLRSATEKITSTLDRMRFTLEELLDHQGQLEGRMDSYEDRLLALEKSKSSGST